MEEPKPKPLPNGAGVPGAPAAPAAPARPAQGGNLLRKLDERIWDAPEEVVAGPGAYLKRWLQIVDRSLRGFVANHGLTYASALTYTSLLAVVPLLAVVLAVLKGFGVDDKVKEALRDSPFLPPSEQVIKLPARDLLTSRPGELGSTATMIMTHLDDAEGSATLGRHHRGAGAATTIGADGFAEPEPGVSSVVEYVINTVSNTNFRGLGVVGVGGLLLLIISLLSQIEKAMNAAWSVYRSRSFARKLTEYLNLIMVVIFLILGFSVRGTGKLIDWANSLNLPGVNYAGAHLTALMSHLLVLGSFIFMYFYIPNTRVRWRSAAAGGIAAWLVFTVMQFGFGQFQGRLLGTRLKIYGAFGSVLLVLFFIYLFWCIVLWGVEVSSAHQNLRDWRRRRRAWSGLPAERETLALRLATLLARPLLGQPEPATLEVGALADRLNVPTVPVAEMLELFRAQGLLIQSAEDGSYLLARSPEQLGVLDLLRMVRQGTLVPDTTSPSQLAGASARLAVLSPLMGMTIKDLAAQSLDSIQTFNL